MRIGLSRNKNSTDEDLMMAVREGNERAFTELYNRYSKRVIYYFYKMLWQNMETARDMHQELFLKLIEKPHLFRPGSAFKTWFFSVANNMCKNEYRKDRPDRKTEPLHTAEQVREPVLPDVDKNDNYLRLKINIDQLEPAHRECIVLRYFENFTVEEISEILGCPQGTVKSRLFFARKKLAESLNGKPILKE
jgi:RNA polymerase sigma-70 factor, ECF subfamily